MTLPLTGALTFNDINVELIRTGTATLELNDANVRTLAGRPTGIIGTADLRGKFWAFRMIISTNQPNLNLRIAALAAGWDGSLIVEVTINAGVYIYGTLAADSTPALTVDGSWPGGLRIVNKGYIVGRGGQGGAGANGSIYTTANVATGASGAGEKGGRALLVSSACTIDNTLGVIAGGGGGGGGSNGILIYNGSTEYLGIGGSGGGGGQSGPTSSLGGVVGTNRTFSGQYAAGTIITAGAVGTTAGPGSGGYVNNASVVWQTTDASRKFTSSNINRVGGAGGAWGAAGVQGLASLGSFSALNCSWVYINSGAGGAAGTAITGNSLITWSGTGSQLGTIIA